MNPLHLELLANDRIAELRRQARTPGFGMLASTAPMPDPRVPRRGPLSAITQLGVFVRAAFA